MTLSYIVYKYMYMYTYVCTNTVKSAPYVEHCTLLIQVQSRVYTQLCACGVHSTCITVVLFI